LIEMCLCLSERKGRLRRNCDWHCYRILICRLQMFLRPLALVERSLSRVSRSLSSVVPPTASTAVYILFHSYERVLNTFQAHCLDTTSRHAQM